MNDIENERQVRPPTATQAYLQKLDSSLWNELSGMSDQEQFQLWHSLVQKHLREFELKNSKPDQFDLNQFEKDELTLLLLNYLYAETVPVVNKDIPVKSFYFHNGVKQAVGTLGQYLSILETAIRSFPQASIRPYSVLFTGPGVSGKATFRTLTASSMTSTFPDHVVCNMDRDYDKIMPPIINGLPQNPTLFLIEDVNALETDDSGNLSRFIGSDGLEWGFDTIVYLAPHRDTHYSTLLQRAKAWIRHGKVDLTSSSLHNSELVDLISNSGSKAQEVFNGAPAFIREQVLHIDQIRKANPEVGLLVIEPTPIFEAQYGFGRALPEDKAVPIVARLENEFKKG